MVQLDHVFSSGLIPVLVGPGFPQNETSKPALRLRRQDAPLLNGIFQQLGYIRTPLWPLADRGVALGDFAKDGALFMASQPAIFQSDDLRKYSPLLIAALQMVRGYTIGRGNQIGFILMRRQADAARRQDNGLAQLAVHPC